MSNCFRVVVHRNSDTLHLRLEGDFDEEAAREVIYQIRANVNGAGRVIIHTNGLGRVLPPSRQAFRKGLSVCQKGGITFVFTGEKAPQIAPQGYRVLL